VIKIVVKGKVDSGLWMEDEGWKNGCNMMRDLKKFLIINISNLWEEISSEN
jgi:hypothetical protein